MTKWVSTFGDGAAEGRASDTNLLGGKGANLAEMSSLGLPVPPGFTITTEVCNWYYANGKTYPPELKAQVKAALAEVGRISGRRFGDPEALLLVSVRSGASGLDARHDGYGAQSRPQRRHRRGAGQGIRAMPASPMTATGASSRCIATWC